LEPFTLRSIKVIGGDSPFKQSFEYIRTICSGKWFSRNVNFNLSQCPEDVYDRLLSEWASVGVVSALLLTLAAAGFFLIQTPEEVGGPLPIPPQVYPLLMLGSMMSLMVSVTVSVLLALGLMTLPKEAAIAFTTEFSYLITSPEITLVFGIHLFCIASVLLGFINYGYNFMYIAVAICCGSFACVWTFYTILVAMLDRVGGLWERGKLLAEQSKRGENSMRKSMGEHKSVPGLGRKLRLFKSDLDSPQKDIES
jgi:hypothetical protein